MTDEKDDEKLDEFFRGVSKDLIAAGYSPGMDELEVEWKDEEDGGATVVFTWKPRSSSED